MFTDALQDTAKFYTIALTRTSYGQQKKGETLLYDDIPCRLNRGSGNDLSGNEGEQQNVYRKDKILVEPAYDGAKKGDKVVCNGINYTIAKKTEAKGRSQNPHHIIYYLDELE